MIKFSFRALKAQETEMTEIRERLARLVAFPSVSGSDMGAMLDWLTAEVAPYASLCQRLPATAHCAEALLVRIGEGEGGLVLAGHLDVVPVAGQPWTGEPFTLREADGRYYGRGVCDMKGFFACALALLPQLPPLRAPLWLAISCDEEIGCLSAPRLARALREHGADGAYVWVGEPTLLQPVVAQKGITNLRTVVHGRAAHSSQVGQGASAIHAAARLVAAIEDVMRELQAEGQLDPHFDVPHASLHIGKISGGTAVNIVADRCQFDWEIRHLPHETFDALRARVAARERALEAQYPGLRIETTPTTATVAALQDADNADWLALLGAHLPDATRQYVAYATEAGAYQQAGMQTLICGPGSIRQAHQADEWIETAQLSQCARVMQAVIAARCGGA